MQGIWAGTWIRNPLTTFNGGDQQSTVSSCDDKTLMERPFSCHNSVFECDSVISSEQHTPPITPNERKSKGVRMLFSSSKFRGLTSPVPFKTIPPRLKKIAVSVKKRLTIRRALDKPSVSEEIIYEESLVQKEVLNDSPEDTKSALSVDPRHSVNSKNSPRSLRKQLFPFDVFGFHMESQMSDCDNDQYVPMKGDDPDPHLLDRVLRPRQQGERIASPGFPFDIWIERDSPGSTLFPKISSSLAEQEDVVHMLEED